MTANYVLLDRIELNATAASVTFDNIPQTGYTDLKVVMSARSDQSGSVGQDVYVRFNGDSGSNYSFKRLYGNGSSAYSDGVSSSSTACRIGRCTSVDATANTFGSTEFYIPNYTSSNAKSISADAVDESNTANVIAQMTAPIWTGTASISSMQLFPFSGGTNFIAGSTFSLYGIAQVGTTPAIAPKADGGNVIGTDGTYWYHAFLSNGTFTPQLALNCDVLVVAGGGSSGVGGYGGAGGGAGGVLGFASESVTTATTVVIGAGGSRVTTNNTKGSNGTNSTFGALTAAVGGGAGTYSTGSTSGNSGGSGGGGAYNSLSGGAGTSGQGNAGGNGNSSNGAGAGGGGYGGAGSASINGGWGGPGGAGSSTVTNLSSISAWLTATALGVSGQIAGGGGGGTDYGSGGAATAGGGNGGAQYAAGTDGVANTGGGGGASGQGNNNGGAGGSGLVIIRYPIAS